MITTCVSVERVIAMVLLLCVTGVLVVFTLSYCHKLTTGVLPTMAVCLDVMLECKGYAYKMLQYFAVSGWLLTGRTYCQSSSGQQAVMHLSLQTQLCCLCHVATFCHLATKLIVNAAIALAGNPPTSLTFTAAIAVAGDLATNLIVNVAVAVASKHTSLVVQMRLVFVLMAQKQLLSVVQLTLLSKYGSPTQRGSLLDRHFRDSCPAGMPLSSPY